METIYNPIYLMLAKYDCTKWFQTESKEWANTTLKGDEKNNYWFTTHAPTQRRQRRKFLTPKKLLSKLLRKSWKETLQSERRTQTNSYLLYGHSKTTKTLYKNLMKLW